MIRVKDKIMAIICDICGAEQGELDENMDIIEAGLIDSFGVVQLLVKLEEEVGITLDIEDLRRHEIATPAQVIHMAEQAL
jgi:D-alanine--poly(phosphoribitol) ligase subunit 2